MVGLSLTTRVRCARLRRVVTLAVAALCVGPASADEGLWLFSQPPRAEIKQRYGVELSDAWLEHLQRSAVRIGHTGSGAMVSRDGLILTNHHVALDCIVHLSTASKDYVAEGFQARTRADEQRCPGLDVVTLVATADVTDRVSAAVSQHMAPAEGEAARRGVIATLERDASRQPDQHAEVVTLYGGAAYHLYRYKKYSDLRLVLAPEEAIAAFGGDADNFEFPRFALDIAFLRAYESGQPARVEHFLTINPDGVREGDPVFIAGHPGSTERSYTVARLLDDRNVNLPSILDALRRQEVMLNAWSSRSPEHARQARADLRSVENARKFFEGRLDGLRAPTLLARKQDEERRLRSVARPQVGEEDPWAEIERVQRLQRELRQEMFVDEFAMQYMSPLLGRALTLLRVVEESGKPDADRLRGFGEAQVDSVRQGLLAGVPIHPELEAEKLGSWLGMWFDHRPDDALLHAILDGHSPNVKAKLLVQGSRLHEAAYRRELLEGAPAAVAASDDALLRVAKQLDPRAREFRHKMASDVDETLLAAQAQIAAVRFAVDGTSVYPDATFTLRLGYGRAIGQAVGVTRFPWTTTLAGAFERERTRQAMVPFRLPDSWRAAESRLAGDTPFNFVTTVDLIGGNSGSPVVNHAGELVGTVFDGNAGTLSYSYAFAGGDARAVNVHVAATLEALRTIYGATALLEELGQLTPAMAVRHAVQPGSPGPAYR